MYTVIFVFFKINSRNIRVILICCGSSMQVGGRVQSRWDLIYTALRGGFKSSLDIRVRILIQCIPIKTEKNPGNTVIFLFCISMITYLRCN